MIASPAWELGRRSRSWVRSRLGSEHTMLFALMDPLLDGGTH